MANSMDKIAAKGMGMIHRASARMNGLEGIFATLCEEHGEAAALLKRLARTNDIDKRRELFPVLRTSLLIHERGELNVLYSRLDVLPGAQAIVQHHNREAAELERAIAVLGAEPFDGAQWQAKIEHLVDLVEHHVAEEQTRYFPHAQELLGEAVARELDVQYANRRPQIERELQQPVVSTH